VVAARPRGFAEETGVRFKFALSSQSLPTGRRRRCDRWRPVDRPAGRAVQHQVRGWRASGGVGHAPCRMV